MVATGSRDPEVVRRNIPDIATIDFAEKCSRGARVDEIATNTNTSKRIIYYYFGDREGLFVAVLEDSYAGIRHIEQMLNLEGLAPVDALWRLTE